MPQPFALSPLDTLSSLIRQIAEGDQAAFRMLYDALRESVCGEIRQRVPDSRAAEAAVYATFVELWWLARFHVGQDAEVAAWISRVAHHRAIERQAIPEPARYDVDTSRMALVHLLGGPVSAG